MPKKRHTAEEAAEILTADNDPDGNESLHQKTTGHLLAKMKISQFYQTLTLMILTPA